MAAESFVSNIAEKFLEKLASRTYQEISSAWGIEGELEKLKEILTTVKTVLLDAEERQTQKEQIRLWLSDLKYALYDAEDVLDDFECETQTRLVLQLYGPTTRKVRRFFSCSNPVAFRFRMAHKVKRVRERLDEIAEQKNKFHLTERTESKRGMSKQREQTHSFVQASDIIGRDEDKENIIKLLTKSSDDGKISVIPVVGIGGLGKTALAKLVYNDEMVVGSFPLRLWVCVSDDFDIKKLVEKIIKEASNGSRLSSDNIGSFEMQQLQKILREKLGNKKYLLVLDDVWNQEPMKWNELKELLNTNVNGCKILVTTRNHRVAEIVGTVPDYNLSGLSDEECLSLFVRYAFKEGEEKQNRKLVEIGKEIVKKCGGVPLAVKTLASLLLTSKDERYWNEIKDSEIWKLEQNEEDVLPALRLSYEQLPSYLKRCFAYCSLFPKDHQYVDLELIPFLMAHGLLQPKNGNDNEDLEDIGLAYLKELCSRSFFQDFEEVHSMFLTFKMHDLMHDLAMSLIQNECSIITSKTITQKITNNTRHLLFVDPTSLPIPNGTPPLILDRVRSISPFIDTKGFSSQSTTHLSLSRFQNLRWLNLNDSVLEILPQEIGKLKHLRFLDLSNSEIERLPKSIYKLQSLQTLSLGGCCELVKLSSDIRCLINLRSLVITTKQKCLPKNGIGCLKSLRVLVIGECENLESLFEDMEGLRNLRVLVITGCTSLICLPQSIIYLTSLETLIISDCEDLDLKMEGKGKDDQNFTPSHLQKLILVGLPKLVELPQWLLQNTLQLLLLANCSNLKELPACLNNLTSLQQLTIEDCDELTERCKPKTGEDWSKISHIPKIVIDGNNIQSTHDL